MKNRKYIFFAFFGVVACSSNVWAEALLDSNSSLSEIQESLLTGDSILFIGFVLWIAYIVFCLPRDTLKQ